MFRSTPNLTCLRRLAIFGFLWAAWVVLPLLTSNVAGADTALDDYNLAVNLYKLERWQAAADQFRAFLKANGTHEKAAVSKLYLGLTLINMENYKAARDELRLFSKDHPQNTNLPQARYRIAECSYLLEDLPAARLELEAYLKDFPKDPFREHALPYLGEVQHRQDDFAAALETFQKAIDAFPQGALIEDAKFGKGRALESLKRDDEAIAQYRELAANRDGSKAADAQFRLGELAFERKKYPDAATAYVTLTKSFPKCRFVPASHLNAGYSYYHMEKYPEAATQFEAASKSETLPDEKPLKGTAEYWLGMTQQSQRQFAKAIETYKRAVVSAKDEPIAESIVFQQAICEQQLGRMAESKQLFERVMSDWPKGDFADDSLHALAEMRLDLGDLDGTEALLTRFVKDYSESSLLLHVELLGGRLELSRAAVDLQNQKPADEIGKHYDVAARRFENVMTKSQVPKIKSQGRYYFAFTRQLQGQHAQALEIIAPLVEEVSKVGAKSEMVDALVVQAESMQAEKKYEAAELSAAAYLDLVPKGRQAARAIAIQAVAATRRGEFGAADVALERLKHEHAGSPLRSATIQQLAELADARKDWPRSARLYEALIPLLNGPESQPFAIRGLAWAQLGMKDPNLAAKTFQRILVDFPAHRLVPECSYYRAEALRDSGQIDDSIAAFDALMRRIPPDKPVEPSAEQLVPEQYSYRAGLQAAHMLNSEKRVKAADVQYEELLKRFPKPQQLPQILNEWALINYNSENSDRADEISRRLLKEAPDSEFADNARFNLAESDLLADRIGPARQAFEELVASEKSDALVKERSLYQLLILAVDQQRWPDVRLLAAQFSGSFPESLNRHYAIYSVAEASLADQKAADNDLDSAKESLNGLRELRNNEEIRSLVWYDRVWVLLAEIAFRQKKYEEVETIVNELRKRPEKSRYLYQAEEVLGRAYKQQSTKFNEAKSAFERVLADPLAAKTETAAKSQFLIGEIYVFQEKWGDASLAYLRVYTNYDFPVWQSAALFQSAKCDEQQQQWKQAAKMYRLLLDKFPTSMYAEDAKKRLGEVMKKLGN